MEKFSGGGLRIFFFLGGGGVEKFVWGAEWLRNFRGGGVEIFSEGFRFFQEEVRFFREGLRFFSGGLEISFGRG